ncbi:MAG: hypothetical protein LBV51_01225 [Acholeplasmatales bacterium]|jgi:hypothetical protein|nr:hypothetical protein [Acholeplasmatales bacterium]
MKEFYVIAKINDLNKVVHRVSSSTFYKVKNNVETYKILNFTVKTTATSIYTDIENLKQFVKLYNTLRFLKPIENLYKGNENEKNI